MVWHKLLLHVALMVREESAFDGRRPDLQIEVLDMNAETKHMLSLVVFLGEK